MRREINSISAIIIPFNEEANIASCLKSVAWADEVVVIDMGSTDRTVEIAREYTSLVFSHPWEPFSDPARNFAIGKASCDWILLLDADEFVTDSLRSSIQSLLCKECPYDVFTLERKHVRFGRVLERSEGLIPEAAPRLFRRGALNWPATVHSLPSLDGLRVQHLSADRHGYITHNTWPTVDKALEKFTRYTRAEAEVRFSRGERYSTGGALLGTVREFVSIFAMQRTYRDGVPGFFYASTMAMYRFFVWMHLWEQGDRRPDNSRLLRVSGLLLSWPLTLLRIALETVGRTLAGVRK